MTALRNRQWLALALGQLALATVWFCSDTDEENGGGGIFRLRK
jgi:hypothetical protein